MKASYLTIGLFLLTVFSTGCDNISEDDRYIKVEKPVIDNPRNLLILEFTGNSCPNCPTGATIVEQIKEEYAPGRVISVGLHPEGIHYTEPVKSIYTAPLKQDLRCAVATAYYKFYKPAGFPCAVFNGLQSSLSTSTGLWMQRAKDALGSSTVMNIDAKSTYDEDSRSLTVDYSVDFLDYVNDQLNVSVWLVENKIMGTQTMPDSKTNLNYEHNNVLRASLNGDWGEELGKSFLDGEKKEGTASITLKEDWVADNCDVVVFIYRDDNKEVEQAISIPISEN